MSFLIRVRSKGVIQDLLWIMVASLQPPQSDSTQECQKYPGQFSLAFGCQKNGDRSPRNWPKRKRSIHLYQFDTTVLEAILIRGTAGNRLEFAISLG